MGGRQLRSDGGTRSIAKAAGAATAADARLAGLRFLVRHQQALADDLQQRLDAAAATSSTSSSSSSQPFRPPFGAW